MTAGVLALIGDPLLRDDVDRVAAAAGVEVVHALEPSSRNVWTAAAAVVVDAPAARRCTDRALPRRDRIVLVGHAEPGTADFRAAISIGADRVLTLPGQDSDLIAALADAVESVRDEQRRGAVVAVIGGRGGAGASLFATALACTAADALLVDADPWGGGIELALGSERETGLRWPDLALRDGRLSYSALRESLPRHPRRPRTTVLSCGRTGTEIEPGPLTAVIEAGRRAGTTVICDLPRRATPAVEAALATTDLAVLITTADVRSVAATGAVGCWVAAVNPNVGLTVRGPAPGGLRASEVAHTVGLPLFAAMRPQPGIADELERGGLRLRPRSPLAVAARRVLAVLQQHPSMEAA